MRIMDVMAISIGIVLLMALPVLADGNPYSVSGIVTDVHGNPVNGANVTLIDWDEKTLASTQTNVTGNYEFNDLLADNTESVSVRVSYNDGNKTYYVPYYYALFYIARGNIIVNASDTQFRDYPPSPEGYLRGILLTNDTPFGEKISGDIYLVSLNGTAQYHESFNASNDRDFFMFHVPAGYYDIYATHKEYQLIYTSETQRIEVIPEWTLDYYNLTSSLPYMEIYIEPGNREAIQPTATITANTSTLPASNNVPNIPVKSAVEVTAGGAAVVSCAYMFFKFFGIGAVTRASGRLDKNKNRNDLFKFIADNPGVTLHDLAHSLEMKLGTIRYHLFILGLNHRIVSSKFNDKFVRYFTNSGSFTKNEQIVISFARREGIKKVLSLLLNKPGLTNAQISSTLGIKVSATSRYTKELLEKGLIEKVTQDSGMPGYLINNDQKDAITTALKRVKNASH